MYVCICKAVSDLDIRRAVAHGACSFEALQAGTGCSTCCGGCEHEARELLADALEREQVAQALPIAA
jgi:bacterioferritin-associated ferredoxin